MTKKGTYTPLSYLAKKYYHGNRKPNLGPFIVTQASDQAVPTDNQDIIMDKKYAKTVAYSGIKPAQTDVYITPKRTPVPHYVRKPV